MLSKRYALLPLGPGTEGRSVDGLGCRGGCWSMICSSTDE